MVVEFVSSFVDLKVQCSASATTLRLATDQSVQGHDVTRVTLEEPICAGGLEQVTTDVPSWKAEPGALRCREWVLISSELC